MYAWPRAKAALMKRMPIVSRAVCGVLGALCVVAGARPVALQRSPPFIRSQLTWFDRAGKKIGVVGNMADYGNLELSPDGHRIAVAVMNDPERGTHDLWLVDVATGQHTAFATEAADENWAIWSRDGRSLVFNSGRNGGLDLYQAAPVATSTFPGEPLLVDRDAKWPVSWSADGRFILYVISSPLTGNDIFVLPLSGDKKPFPFLQTAAQENWAAFSPDGHWVAYSSDESGQAQVYVAAFPPSPAGRRWLVSKGGGSQARWRRDGKELYFMSSDREIMAASVTTSGSAVELRAAQPLFETHFPYPAFHAFDVAADGQRFLVATVVTPPGSPVIAH
jgi:dipeptidyl aminopeptidase/acylaminoacyl peptidase